MLLATMRAEAETRGERADVDVVAGAGNRSGSERQLVELRQHGVEAADDRDGMRPRGRERSAPTMTGCARRRCVYDGISASPHLSAWRARTRTSARYGRLDLRNAALQIEAKIERDLFVARPAGVQSPAGIADARDELAFDERMDVLVGLRRVRVEERQDRAASATISSRAFVMRDASADDSTPARAQRLRPRDAARHIVFEQAPIELERRAELEERGIGIAGEPARPEMRHLSAPRRRPRRLLAGGGLRRQAPDLDEPFGGGVIESVAGVVRRQPAIVERVFRAAADHAAIALEQFQAHACQ